MEQFSQGSVASHVDGSQVDGSQVEGDMPTAREMKLYQEATAFEGAAVVSMIERDDEGAGAQQKVLEITMEDGVTLSLELDSGEKRLNELGYLQRLNRILTFPELYAVGISTMSLFAGIAPLYGSALLNGGPAGTIWYWLITAFFVHLIGLSMAEISSSFPTAGSLYFWAASLAGPQHGPLAAFITAWLEFIGLAVGMSSVSYNGALFIQVLVAMCTGTNEGGGLVLNRYEVFGISLGIIIICALINSCNIRVVSGVLSISAIWQIGGALALIIALPIVAVAYQPASWVFTNTEALAPAPSPAYSFIICLLLSQYSLYGYDGVAHLAEETKRSDRTAPAAILSSLSTVTVIGWGLLVSLTFCIQTLDDLFSPDTATQGLQPTVQIIWDVFYGRFQSGLGAEIFTGIMFGSFFFGCIAGQLGASRVSYALARDRGMPLSSVWSRLATNRVPVFSLWLSTFIGIVFLLPLLIPTSGPYPYVFYAITSIATIGWLAAYSVPIFFRLIQKESEFKPGPFYLANYVGVTGGKVIHFFALLWVLYTCIAFALPSTFPVTWEFFNYAPFAILLWTILFMSWWFLQARYWFKGPIREFDEDGNAGDEGAYLTLDEQQELKTYEGKQE